MILNSEIRLKKGVVTGSLIKLQNASLIVINSSNGYLMCRYLNMDVANKLGDIAGKVTGINDFKEALEAKIVELSDNAKKLGLKTGISGRQFLNEILSR
ncbi:MAG: DUF1805 domain-containing protein [Thermoplasmatales archaeon]|nr:DUF1805 domain-containing protein [Thermoplasmatales archaeon]